MRSPSWPESAGVVLGAAAEGIWSGGLAAALTGASGAALIVYAGVTVGVGAASRPALQQRAMGEGARNACLRWR